VDRSLEHLVRETAVHRSVYLDPDIFACELERIFGSTWIYVAHESEIPEAGDFKRATIERIRSSLCAASTGRYTSCSTGAHTAR